MQQVNLYQPILRKEEKVFSARTLMIGNLLILTGLVLLFLYSLVLSDRMRSQLQHVQTQRDTQVKDLATLSARYPAKSKDSSIQLRIAQARQELQHKQKLFTTVGKLGIDTQQNYSTQLSALARQDVPQLWLHRITLQQGRNLALQGSALQAAEIPRYLQRLANEKIFSGIDFHSAVIQRVSAESDQVEFSLKTAAQSGKEVR